MALMFVDVLMTVKKTTRKKIAKHWEQLLFSEVNSCCPVCLKFLCYETETNQMRGLYEIAHIYPFSPRPDEEILLRGLERLSDDVDSNDNLILLCRDCHKKFDNPRTIAGYIKMVDLKKKIIKNNSVNYDMYKSQITYQMSIIIDRIKNIDDDDIEQPLNLSAKALNEKIFIKGDKSISNTLRRQIQNNVTYYYQIIESCLRESNFRELDSAEEIAIKIRLYYLTLKRDGMNQSECFKYITEWLYKMTDSNCRTTSEIIVSYFIQHCEIFE